MKFDLARKYLVGFLTLAMVMSLFVMPVATAAPEPIVNASQWSVTVSPTSDTNPVDSPTHVLTINTKLDGTLADPAQNVAVATATGVVITPSIAASRTSTGVYTATVVYGVDVPAVPGQQYKIYAFIDADNSGGISEGDVISDAVTKTWATRAPASFTVVPTTATNTTGQTHTITVTVKDQFGDLIDANVTGSVVAGPNAATTLSFSGGSGTYTATYGFTCTDLSGFTPPYKDTIVINVQGVGTATVYKTWTYTPVFQTATATPQVAWNFVGESHTVTVNFVDQYNVPIAVTATLNFSVSGANTATGLVKGTNKTALSFSYTGKNAGNDSIAITGTVNGTSIGPITVFKHWAYEWDVEPDMAVNALGAEHTFTVYGAPGDSFAYTFVSAGILSMDDLLVWSLEGWQRASLHDQWYGTIGQDGTAEITVMSQAPGKFYMDVTFGQQDNDDDDDPYGRTPVTIKVSKAYAELTGFRVINPMDINPITQTPSDTHTVTVQTLGEFPVKYSSVIPSNPPPEGGEYVLIGGILFVKDAPVANVNVDWKVSWTDQVVNRKYVSSHVDGGLTGTPKYAPGTPPFYFTASSLTDENGYASLTYKLDWNGVGTPTVGTCTLHFSCISDSIQATAGYGIDVLDAQYGTITATASKEWRDYSFKLIKYDYNIPPNAIAGAKFYLKRLDLTGTPTYVPPTGNAWVVVPGDPPGVVTTDTTGAAIWYHLPYGTYGLFEYSVPDPYAAKTGTLFTFVVNENEPYWCNPTGDKQIVHEERNFLKPTKVEFYKIGYCFARLSGVQFVATNLDTLQEFPATSAADGKVSFSGLTYSAYPGAKTWYKVHEISVPSPYYQVNDFYFYLDDKGVWNDKFYDKPDLPPDSIEVWPRISHPELGGTAQHWVVDPKIGLVLSLTPSSQTVLVNNNATLTAKATLSGVAQQGVWIDFFVNGVRIEGKFTDASGQATFTYTNATPGVDTILAKSNVYEAQAQVVWAAPPQATVTFNLVQGWNMVTPGVVSAKTAAEIFGANFVHAYHWDPTLPGPDGSLGGWIFCDNQALVPGLGYWVRMSAASTVALNGTPVTSPFTLALSQGWNQVGNPFETNLSVANVKVIQGTTEKSLADAFTAGWIGYAYSWNGSSYDSLNYSTGTLPAGKGFWLRVLVDGLSIKFTK